MTSMLFDLIAPVAADRTAVILPEQNRRVTYGDLRNQVEAMAEALAGAGIGRGDRVAIALPNGLAMLVSLLAASMTGTAAPLNPADKEDGFRFLLEDTGARVLLVPPDGPDETRRAAGARVRTLEVAMDAAGTVTLPGATRRCPVNAGGAEEIAIVLHTSGSTSGAKRVPLAHANLCASAANIARTYALSADDVSLCVMPLFHVHGLVASTLATLATGGTVVILARFNPLVFWRTANDVGATWYSAVPTQHQLLLAALAVGNQGSRPPAGAERLRFIRSCSAALPVAVLHAVENAFGAPVLEAYGMTEAAHQITSNPLPPAARKPGTVGAPTGVQVSIVDPKGTHLRHGERGEVVIKGPSVIRGYDNQPEANAASFVDGWFRTGDEGCLDGDGYLMLTGRIKELINRGGEKISPRELDDVLLAHPAVAEAVTFGVPHPMWGEEVVAAVVLRGAATEADLLAYCRERVADFKRPKQIHITDTIPRTATGKVQRRLVAQVFAEARS
jgi:acyl-CoA synthetase (AMP-forming)/AMP-acid ligase II